MDKVVVLFSGGLDSSTLLYKAVHMYGAANTIALNMFYGQRHAREMKSAEVIADGLGVRLITMDISTVMQFSDSAMLAAGKAVPHEDYAEQLKKKPEGKVDTFVPFRNGLLLSCAASVAESLGANIIAYGAHHDDAAGDAYPDCSLKFIEAMNEAVYQGTRSIRIWAPFAEYTKADIVREGLALKVPYALTWSCYEGGEKACGTCGTCIDRQKAFYLNGCVDPIDYVERIENPYPLP